MNNLGGLYWLMKVTSEDMQKHVVRHSCSAIGTLPMLPERSAVCAPPFQHLLPGVKNSPQPFAMVSQDFVLPDAHISTECFFAG